MIHGRSASSLIATAAEVWQVSAGLVAYVATVLQSNKKKFQCMRKKLFTFYVVVCVV
jgi:hypothetical protein